MGTPASNPIGGTARTGSSEFAGMLLIWLLYTLLYTLPIPDVLAAFVQLLPGVAAVFFLRHSGYSATECYLVMRRVSLKGIVALALVSLALAGPILTGQQ